ncbi:gastrula zinc finger protein XlCGF26.1-like isoform X2 [Periplaneta americana]|uniref:gastrula zinc finger protein XlCGF26.1-like isoform X2 n=1 Tax=Periplaneta americana TaxID=6978 RepID=UPI0037E96435
MNHIVMSNSYNMTLNFATICRLCMQEKPTLLSLFSDGEISEQVTPLRCKIMSLAPAVKVDLFDGLPTHVCRQCVNQVNVSYNFKKQCEISDATFREYLKNQRLQQSESSEDKQNDEQCSEKASDEPSENWAYVKVKAELLDFPSDDNNGAEHEFPAAICSLTEGQNPDTPCNVLMDQVMKQDPHDIRIHGANNIHMFGKNLNSGNDYNIQMKANNPKKKFVCIECGKQFIQKQHLISHMRTHTGERPFMCKECGKTFAQTVHLKNHQITHTRLKPFSCSECGKCFAQNIHLKNHLSTHTGEKPYGCNLCGKTFAQNVHLKNHLSTHTGEKPFRCTECGKTFAQNIHLKNHLSTHTHEKPYGCTECGKTFAQNIHLKNHLATHTGEKPYGCTECGKHFARSGQLKEHMKLHLGVKPYTCVECGKSFSQNIHLKNHLATHSGIKKAKVKAAIQEPMEKNIDKISATTKTAEEEDKQESH